MDGPIAPSTEAEVKALDDLLVAFNRSRLPFSQDPGVIPLNFHLKDEAGKLVAGVNAYLYFWNILFIAIFFVDPAHRGQGAGSRLLRYVEGRAMDLGAQLAHGDTFDFQAKDFYLKHGYEVFGVLEDCPPGHRRFYLKKQLRPLPVPTGPEAPVTVK